MRRHAQSWIIKAALGGIIVVFIFWYGWSGPREGSREYAAKVNDTIITRDFFRSVYDSKVEQIKLRFKGGAIPPDLLEKMNLKMEVARGLVNQILLLQEGERLGLAVTTADLVQDIRSNPMFQRNGAFDEAMYRVYLQTIKMTPSMYEQNRRRELQASQVADLLTDAVKTDPEEIKRFWHFQNDKLVLSMLLVKAEEPAQAASIDPKLLESYFKQNQDKYAIPASVNLQCVTFSWRDIEKKITVTPEQAKEYYNFNPREFTEPEKIRAKHILVKVPPNANEEQIEKARKTSQEILEKLKNGADFDAVAREMSQDEATREKGGDLGFFSKGTMNPALERAAAKLQVGKLSEPIRTDQGYEILMVTEKTPEKLLAFDAVKDKIIEKLLREKAKKQVRTDADDFYEMVYRAEELEPAAKKFGFPVHKAENVTRAGGIPDVAAGAKIMDEAFELKTGEISRLLKSDDTFVVFKLLSKTKERIPGLEEVRSEVEKDFRKQQALAGAGKRAEEIIKELKDKTLNPEEIAAKYGLKWENLDAVSRTAGIVPRLGNAPEVIEMLTTITPESSVYGKPLTVSGGAAVLRLVDLQRASEEQYAKDAADFERWVKEVRKTEFLKGWLRTLEEKAKVDINEKAL
jgi:peptidyl-prolyl cis-trans isomerase D